MADDENNKPEEFLKGIDVNEAEELDSEQEKLVSEGFKKTAETLSLITGGVVPRLIEHEMKKSYLDYAMSVIVGRALPDVRDGLKPVHRRILFAMNELGMHHNKPFKKSARIVGEVLGKYHPHGDVAIYDTLVRMVQDFSLRYPLISGQGNFGSIDGDNAAAMRYTEARLAKISDELLEDIDKETIDFTPNFDGSLKEPLVLPAKLPNLLINGSSGIAVGMATNIPPHNLTEVGNGVIHLIDNPDAKPTDLMKFIRGPDFPTGSTILGKQGIYDAYTTGKGKIIVRSKTKIEEKGNKKTIIVTEIPYQINKSTLIEEIAEKIQEKKIEGISGLRDESNREGIRIVIELKKDANSDIVLNQLYKNTRMEESFGIILLALVNNEPRVLNLKEIVQNYIEHRVVVVKRRTEFELKKARERVHILEGLIIALNDIDAVVQKIKKSKNAEMAVSVLVADYKLTEIQAKAILDMKLQRLAALEQEKIRQENLELNQKIKEYSGILASQEKINQIIKNEVSEIVQKYGDSRKTEISEEGTILEDEDLIREEEVVITITDSGYIKRMPVSTYKQQNRGGKGVIGADTKETDSVKDLYVASTHDYLLVLTTQGMVHWVKVFEIPVASRTAMGKAIVNLIPIEKDERVSAIIPVKEFSDKNYVVFATKDGTVKKTNLSEYSRPRKGGIRAIILDEGDELIEAKITNGNNQIMLATKNGNAARFHEEDARPIGRTAKGVRGILLKEKDEVIGMIVVNNEKNTIFTITENGYGKRSPIEDYRFISRGGSGVINIQCTERNGNVVSVNEVTDDDELMIISKSGIIIRIPAKTISVIGRNTQGVRIMKLDEKDHVVAARKIIGNGE
jgi:DNA gyrase subunit A